MARINLLPWREEERGKRNREFIGQLVVVALLSLLASFAVWTFYNSELEDQREANDVVKQANIALDRDLKQIEDLEKQKEDIISHMKVIQDLQGKRPIPVHVFDNLTRILPRNLFLNEVSLKGAVLTLKGRSDNPKTVSDFIRNVDRTRWLSNSAVISITSNNVSKDKKPARDNSGKVIVSEASAPEAGYISFIITSQVLQVLEHNVQKDASQEAPIVEKSMNNAANDSSTDTGVTTEALEKKGSSEVNQDVSQAVPETNKSNGAGQLERLDDKKQEDKESAPNLSEPNVQNTDVANKAKEAAKLVPQ